MRLVLVTREVAQAYFAHAATPGQARRLVPPDEDMWTSTIRDEAHADSRLTLRARGLSLLPTARDGRLGPGAIRRGPFKVAPLATDERHPAKGRNRSGNRARRTRC